MNNNIYGTSYQDYTALGLNIHTAPPPQPKLKLSSKVVVSPEFRIKTDTWLAATFGYNEPIIPKGQVLVSKDFIVMNPEDIAIFNTTV